MTRNWIVLIAIGVAVGLFITLFSPWASSEPDGLERVAGDKGFIDEGKGPPYEVIADYVFPGVDNERLATVLAGVVGVFIVTGISLGVGFGLWAVSRGRTQARARAGDRSPPNSPPDAGRDTG
jgi:cobalt/nickel transport protein